MPSSFRARPNTPGAQADPSPPQTPQSSITALPPHSPAQSSTAEPPHSPAQSSTFPSQSQAPSAIPVLQPHSCETPSSSIQSSISSQIPSASTSSQAGALAFIVKQSEPEVSRPFASESDTMTALKQGDPSPSYSRVISVPEPAAIVEPVKLNPTTLLLPVDTVNPAASAAPPLTPVTVTSPSTWNWKPAISVSLL